jgi:NADH-quinone oxidoreductase subunit N
MLLTQLAQVEPIEVPAVDWGAIGPLAILTGGALVILLFAALFSGRVARGTWAGATVLVCAGSVAAGIGLWDRVHDDGPSTVLAGALTLDGFSVFFAILISVAIALAALLTDDYLRREDLEGAEVYVLMLLSGAGGVIMAMANDLIVLFLGLEILSIAMYVLAGSHARRIESQESAMKYFVLGSFSSAFLLYGIALVYGATGSTNLSGIGEFLAGNVLQENALLLAGFALMLVGLGFKVSAAPFHVWTPDVYQGAPSPIAAFLASVAKAAGFAGLLRVFFATFETYRLDWQPIVWVLAVLTLLVGAFLAIVQTDVKRMLAYSSVNHAGFVLIGLQAATTRGAEGSLFYLLAYTFMVVGSFGVVTVVSRRGDADHSLESYKGLAARRPGLALAFAVFLLAQAGVPLTSGFLAKFYVIGAAVDSGSYALAIIAMLSSTVSAFLYLRIVVAMYMQGDEATAARPRIRIPTGAAIGIGVALAATIVFGVLPGIAVDWARDAVPVLVAGP